MVNRRGWVVLALLTTVVVIIGTCGKARAKAAEPLDNPCSFIRTAVRVAGGLDSAIREALRRG